MAVRISVEYLGSGDGSVSKSYETPGHVVTWTMRPYEGCKVTACRLTYTCEYSPGKIDSHTYTYSVDSFNAVTKKQSVGVGIDGSSDVVIYVTFTRVYSVGHVNVSTSVGSGEGTTSPVDSRYSVRVDSTHSSTISARPAVGYVFDHWTSSGTNVTVKDPYSSSTTISVPVYDEREYYAHAVAHFVTATYTVAVSASPGDGGTVSGGATDVPHGSSVTVSAVPDEHYTFDRWDGLPSGGGYDPRAETLTVTVVSDLSLTARFIPKEYEITVSGDPPDAVSNTNGSGTYTYGSTVTVSVIPRTGYRIVRWSDDGTADRYRTVLVSGDADYVAVIEPIPVYTLTKTASPPEAGTVDGGPPGQVVSVQDGYSCEFVASPSSGFMFSRWWDGCTTPTHPSVTIHSDIEVIAYFVPIPPKKYTLTVVSSDPARGTVTGSGTYDAGTEVLVTSTAAPRSRLKSWSDGATDNHIVVVDGDKTITATFEDDTVRIGLRHFPAGYNLDGHVTDSTIATKIHGQVKLNGANMAAMISKTYEFIRGDSVRLTITHPYGDGTYYFVRWEDGTTDLEREIVLTEDFTEVHAHFGCSALHYDAVPSSATINRLVCKEDTGELVYCG